MQHNNAVFYQRIKQVFITTLLGRITVRKRLFAEGLLLLLSLGSVQGNLVR